MGTGTLESDAQGSFVVIRDGFLSPRDVTADVGEVGAIVITGFRVRRQRDRRKLGGPVSAWGSSQSAKTGTGSYSAAMEVVLYAQHHGAVLRNALDLVSPFPGDLDGTLDRLRARVHRQDHVETEEAGDEFGEAREDVIIEGTGAEGETGRLIDHDLDQLGVAMALVDGGIGGEEVEIVSTLGVPDGDSSRTGKDNGEWVVVVGGILLFRIHGGLRGRDMKGSGLRFDSAGRGLGGRCRSGCHDGFVGRSMSGMGWTFCS